MARWSTIERSLRESGARHIAGVDEVGRGPFAGPVVACAIVMPSGARAISGVADSKQLDADERVRLAAIIRRRAVVVSLGAASVREIAALNIYQATSLAMRRALARADRVLERSGTMLDAVIVDGTPIATLGRGCLRVDRGEGRPRSPHADAGAAPSRVRVGVERRVWDPASYRGTPSAGDDSASPGSVLPRGAVRSRGGRGVGRCRTAVPLPVLGRFVLYPTDTRERGFRA